MMLRFSVAAMIARKKMLFGVIGIEHVVVTVMVGVTG